MGRTNHITSDMIKPIPNAPHYMACSDGRIFSLYTMKWLIPNFEKSSGYMQVSICEKSGLKQVRIHRLIALAFCDGYEPGKVVNHKNENKLDNRAENLEWVTTKENLTYGTAKERAVRTIGIDNLRKSAEHARSIRSRQHERPVRNVSTGIEYPSIKDAADSTGLRRTGIWGACNGTQKTCGGYEWEYIDRGAA